MIALIMTLANSIIGVSVLAMPFCFKQCGIVLATLILFFSSLLSRLACHYLIKSAVMSRRKNFEFLAFHAFGPMGKFLAELFIIGFLLGTCIAFFVVVGDLGPQIIGELVEKRPEDIRTAFLIGTSVFIVLPLGLLKNIDSLASVNTAAIGFYICLVLKIISESMHHIFIGDWMDNIDYWRPAGVLQCLPIFAMALFCQTQLFEIYQAVPNASLEKMNYIVQGALNICTLVYISVGFFGYIAFCMQPFTGNILISLEPSFTSEIIKIGFVLSVAFSFPLVIFPCRASLYSLLFRRVYYYSHETSSNYIPERKFKCITVFIIGLSLTIGILIPNIEFVLGIVGSTIGVMICLIFPAAFFISISTKQTNERLIAQLLLFIGLGIMILGTYANLYAMEKSTNLKVPFTSTKMTTLSNNLANNNHIGNVEHEIIKSKILDPIEVGRIEQDKSKIFGNKIDSQVPEAPLQSDKTDPEKLKQIQEPAILSNPQNIDLKKEAVIEDMKSKKVNDKIKEKLNSDKIELSKNIKAKNFGKNKKKLKYEIVNNKENKIESNVLINEIDGNQEKKIVQDVQRNDVHVDAIKKEESEVAANLIISNSDTVKQQEELKKILEQHLQKQKQVIKEERELLEDIKQQKKELELEKKERLTKQSDNKIFELSDKENMLNKDSNLRTNNEVLKDTKIFNETNKANIKNQPQKVIETMHINEQNSKLTDEKKSIKLSNAEISNHIIDVLSKDSVLNSSLAQENVKAPEVNESSKVSAKQDYFVPLPLKLSNKTDKVISELDRKVSSEVQPQQQIKPEVAPKNVMVEDGLRKKRAIEISASKASSNHEGDESFTLERINLKKHLCQKSVSAKRNSLNFANFDLLKTVQNTEVNVNLFLKKSNELQSGVSALNENMIKSGLK